MKRFLAVVIVFVAMLCFGQRADAGPVRNAVFRVGTPVVRLAAKPLKAVKAIGRVAVKPLQFIRNRKPVRSLLRGRCC